MNILYLDIDYFGEIGDVKETYNTDLFTLVVI